MNNYSCIFLLAKFIEKLNKEPNGDFYIIIDEPEKFCHQNLLDKLLKCIEIISQKVNVYISSHSQYFISRLYSFKNKPKLLFFKGKHKNDVSPPIEIQNTVFELDNNEIFRKVLVKNILYRTEFIANLFASKIIIVEDNSTKILLQFIFEQNNITENINIYVCHGKK
ncbi:MAG: hypothetical protein LBU40_06830 [Methanobrevibacter sp.]|nr:hypothetical protein [Methanobrevibacter sp.]